VLINSKLVVNRDVKPVTFAVSSWSLLTGTEEDYGKSQ
jgi:hypothetical protein